MTWIYCKRLSGYIILMTCAAAHVHASTAGADNPHFVNVRLPYGLSVDVPQSWRVLGDEENQLIELSASAVLDLTGLTPEGDGDITLFAANSMPRSTYASIRVELLDAMDLSEAEAANLQPEDLADMNAGVLEMLNAILSAQGLALIDYYGTSLEWIQSKPCVSIRYRRSGPSGPVMTERLIVFSDESQWGINLAYRQSETGLWLPVINRIK